MLGLLALLLGFTFTLGLQRFDHRSHAITDDANAIGSAEIELYGYTGFTESAAEPPAPLD